jgi:hypothetical protein
MSGVATAASPLARDPQPQIPGRDTLALSRAPIILAVGALAWEIGWPGRLSEPFR